MNRIVELIKQNQLLVLGLVLVLIIVWCQQSKNKFESSTSLKESFKDYVSHTGFLPDGKYVIRGSRNQRYCSDDPNGVICTTDFPGPREIFTLQHLEGEMYAIQGQRSGLWCSLTSTGLRCESPTVGDWEVFKIHPLGGGKFSIQSTRNGKWCVDSGHGMVCDVPSMYGWDFQQFEFIPIRYNNIK